MTVRAKGRKNSEAMPCTKPRGRNTATVVSVLAVIVPGDLARAGIRGGAHVVTLLQVAEGVLDDHDGVVDHAADGDGEAAEREHVERLAARPQDDEAPITLSGMERPAISVERQLRRKTRMMSTAKTAPSETFAPQRGDALLDVEGLVDDRVIFVLPAKVAVMAGQFVGDGLAMSTVLPVDDLLTERPIEDSPLVRVIAVSGVGAMPRGDLAQGDRLGGHGGAPAAAVGHTPALCPAAPAATAAPTADVSAGAITRRSIAFTVCARAVTVMGYTRLPD